MATSAVYGDRVKIPDAQSLQLSTPPGFGQYWSYGKDGSGNTIFKYINPDSPKMTQAYNAQNQIVDVPDIGWDGQPWTNRKWLNQINGFSISPDGRSMVSTVPPGQTNVSGVDSSQRYTLNGSGLNTNVNFSYSNQWGSGGSSATLLNISDVAPEKQGEYLSGLTKYATGEYLPVKQYVTKTGDAFGDFLASIDPSTAISRELTNLYQPVEKAISTGLADVDKNLSLSKNAPVIAAVAIAVVVPVVGAEIGASLMEAGVVTSAAEASAAVMAAGGTAAQAAAAAASATATATAVGTAIASATAQVAQGVPVEEAIRNATVAATVQLNAPGAAKAVNDIVGNPVVSNLVSSTAASVVQTAATGGSEADIIRNARGALIGSGVSSGTDSNVLGRAAAGGVTGGVAGALVGAAGAIGSDAAKPAATSQTQKATDTTVTTAAEEPVTTTTTEAATTAPVTTDQAIIDLTGIGAGNAAVTTEQVTTPGATDTFTGAVDLGQTGTTDQAGTFTGGVDLGETGPVTQTDTFTGAVDLGQTGPAATDTFTGAVDLGDTGEQAPTDTFTGGVDLGDTGPEEQTDTFTGGVDLGDTGDIIDTGGVDLGDTGEDLSDTETDITTEDTTYKPDLFVYGGKTSKTPTTPGRQTTNLGTTLQAPFYPTSNLGQALTGYRGAGEIEGKKTGKPRKDVWNEESLRLKDALGL